MTGPTPCALMTVDQPLTTAVDMVIGQVYIHIAGDLGSRQLQHVNVT